MRRRRNLVAAALAAGVAVVAAAAAAAPGVPSAAGPAPARPDPPTSGARRLEADLRLSAFHLWEQSGFGADRSERAAWIVAAPEGLVWRPWPSDKRYLESRWLGPTPHGAIAIVHTHPAAVDPRPSYQDCVTATRLRVLVYTVSRSGIWKAGPGGVITRVGDETWWAGCGSGRPCREAPVPPFALADAKARATGETPANQLRITE